MAYNDETTLLQARKGHLLGVCKELNVDTTGSRRELIEQILNLLKDPTKKYDTMMILELNSIKIPKNRGIQKGTIATDQVAREMDNQVKKQSNEVYETLKHRYPDLKHFRKLDPETQVPGGQTPCEPDGGIFYYKGVIIVVSEAKKQQNKGNAIERWYKNNDIIRILSPKATFLTFCVGEGCNNKIPQLLSVRHLNEYNTLHITDNSLFLNVDGFEDCYIQDCLTQAIESMIILVDDADRKMRTPVFQLLTELSKAEITLLKGLGKDNSMESLYTVVKDLDRSEQKVFKDNNFALSSVCLDLEAWLP